jgi:predicted MFS family arabinose efflux permease
MTPVEEQPSVCDKVSEQREPHIVRKIFSTTFASLAHRNYRLFFFGQVISLIGTWTQSVAQGWLVYDMRRSPFLLGLITSFSMLPTAFLSFIGGAVADRFPRRTILLVTQTASIFPPLILGILILTGTVEVWHIAAAALMLGTINAFDMPTRQAFVIEMVGREDLMNAISLNSGMFNAARIAGPAVAGIVMRGVGVGYCFVINGLSFIAAVVALVLIKLSATAPNERKESAFRHLASGIKYAVRDRRLLGVFGLVAIVSIFGFSYVVLLPALVRDTFGKTEREFTNMLIVTGIGALVGALIVATIAKKTRSKRRILLMGITILSVSLFAISLSRDYHIALIPLPFIGMGMIMFLSTANTLIQTRISDEYRGRIMGMWTFVFGGSAPVGAIIAGAVAEKLGVLATIQISASICFFFAVLAYIISRRIAAKNDSHPADDKPRTSVRR